MTQTDPRDGSWAVNQSYRNPDFDGLRALSIVFVLLLHATYGRLHGGFLGVDIFFVLSGYLITTLLVNEMRRTGTISLTAFYVRRAYRILPVLFITVALGMIVAPSQSPQQEHWLLVSLTAIFFVANFLPADVMGNLGHTWSLAVEEQFYLIWPAVLLFSSKANRYAPLALAVCISLLAVWIRHEMIVHPTSISIYTFSLARMDSIMMGCLVALANATWAGGGGEVRGGFGTSTLLLAGWCWRFSSLRWNANSWRLTLGHLLRLHQGWPSCFWPSEELIGEVFLYGG